MSVALTNAGRSNPDGGRTPTVAGCLRSVMSRMTTFVMSFPIQARTRLRLDGAEGANAGAARSAGQSVRAAEALVGDGPKVAAGMVRVVDAECAGTEPEPGPHDMRTRAARIPVGHFISAGRSTAARPKRYPGQKTSSDLTNAPR